MGFGKEKCTMLVMKSDNDIWPTEWNYQIKKD